MAARGTHADHIPLIAFLGAESASTNQHFFDAFRQGMREHGYVDGQNVTFVELLKEAVPNVSRVALLWNPVTHQPIPLFVAAVVSQPTETRLGGLT